MADEPQSIPMNMDPNAYHITGMNINADEEQFSFQINTGNQIRLFLSSPKHAKRILLLLQQIIAAYESKFGEIQTALPEATGQTSKKPFGFAADDEKK